MPFDIVFKTKKVDKPSIVAICDVSKSVAAAAQFLLTFLYSLNEVVDRMEAFAFSGRMISVNAVLDEHHVETAILEVLKRIGFQQTDYGKSLEDFCEQHLDQLDRHTTVIFLGDARSNYADPRPKPETLTALRSGDPRALAAVLENDLQEATVSLRPRLGEILGEGLGLGALGGIVSGSGPTIAFLVEDNDAALDLAVGLTASGACADVRRAVGPVHGAHVLHSVRA